MTTRRRLLVFGLLAGLLVLGAGFWLLWPRTAITLENAAKVRPAMTLDEVEFILGGPPRSDETGPTSIYYYEVDEVDEPQRIPEPYSFGPTPGPFDRHAWFKAYSWRSDCAMVTVGLTDWGRVEWIIAIPCHRHHEGSIAKLRHWLRL